MQGPLFKDGSFDFVPIPDIFGVSSKTYGNTVGLKETKLIEYFPRHLRQKMTDMPIHDDPEFESFTYGDPTKHKQRLRTLKKHDLLVLYAGLEGFGPDFRSDPALYIIGYFVLEGVCVAKEPDPSKLQEMFARNFHVRYRTPLLQKDPREKNLILVKGGPESRLLTKAHLISEDGPGIQGQLLKVLSKKMRHEVFGDLGGCNSLQRSTPRWIKPEHVGRAAEFARGLP